MIEVKLIINVLIALFCYNILLKSLVAVFIKRFFETKVGQKMEEEVHKTFEERLKEKIELEKNGNSNR
jgi:hypothetical protein